MFSSGPCGPPEELKPEGDPVDIAELVETLRPVEHRVFAGMIDKDKLYFAERAVRRRSGGDRSRQLGTGQPPPGARRELAG